VESSVSRDCKPVGGEDMTGKSLEGTKGLGRYYISKAELGTRALKRLSYISLPQS
jgi:hypothetical protein